MTKLSDTGTMTDSKPFHKQTFLFLQIGFETFVMKTVENKLFWQHFSIFFELKKLPFLSWISIFVLEEISPWLKSAKNEYLCPLLWIHQERIENAK